MKTLKKFLLPLSFTLGGALIGLVLYFVVGCNSGTCSILSDPFSTMLYLAVIGFLLSIVASDGGRSCSDGSCRVEDPSVNLFSSAFIPTSCPCSQYSFHLSRSEMDKISDEH